ncbi:MAG: hypothetical protein ABSH21_10425 [Verrucomicrobiia bacterium]|jgi:hypothetical protein
MSKKAHVILDRMKKDGYSASVLPSHLNDISELLVTLGDDAERLTKWLIGLTLALTIISAALLAYTVVLYNDTQANADRGNFAGHAEQ